DGADEIRDRRRGAQRRRDGGGQSEDAAPHRDVDDAGGESPDAQRADERRVGGLTAGGGWHEDTTLGGADTCRHGGQRPDPLARFSPCTRRTCTENVYAPGPELCVPLPCPCVSRAS